MNSTRATRAHAQDILDYISEHPDEHDQNNWVTGTIPEDATPETGCGTTMCVAGTSIFLKHGPAMLNDPIDLYSTLAGVELGLNAVEKEALFYSMSNAQAVEALEAIAAGDHAGLDTLVRNAAPYMFEED